MDFKHLTYFFWRLLTKAFDKTVISTNVGGLIYFIVYEVEFSKEFVFEKKN